MLGSWMTWKELCIIAGPPKAHVGCESVPKCESVQGVSLIENEGRHPSMTILPPWDLWLHCSHSVQINDKMDNNPSDNVTSQGVGYPSLFQGCARNWRYVVSLKGWLPVWVGFHDNFMIVIRLDGTTIIWRVERGFCDSASILWEQCDLLAGSWGLGRWYQLEETFETVTRDELFLVLDNIFPGVKFCCSQSFFWKPISRRVIVLHYQTQFHGLYYASNLWIQPTPRIVTLGLQSMEELSLVYVITSPCRRWRTARRSKYWSYEAGNMTPNSRLLGIHWCIHFVQSSPSPSAVAK